MAVGNLECEAGRKEVGRNALTFVGENARPTTAKTTSTIVVFIGVMVVLTLLVW
jgi:hypothetical protein